MKEFPVISIVTPTYNQGKYIEQTICSVLAQNYPALEYIIIDGGSTDNTLEIIKKYEKHLKYWVSEKDKGQVDAINKGLKHCTGTIFNWLNSDDYLESGSLNKIAALFNDSDVELVAGCVRYVGGSAHDSVDSNALLTAEGLMCWYKGVQFVQPGVWMKRDLIKDAGGIDDTMHYCFDRDMLVRYLYKFPTVKYTSAVLVNFRLHPESKTVSESPKFAEEGKKIFRKVIADKELALLHKAAKYKINRSEWVAFLKDVANDFSKHRLSRIIVIIKRIYKQPKDIACSRITVGAIVRILKKVEVS